MARRRRDEKSEPAAVHGLYDQKPVELIVITDEVQCFEHGVAEFVSGAHVAMAGRFFQKSAK